MDLINVTGMQAGYTMGMKPSGREMIVVAIKGTFEFPKYPDEEPQLAEVQLPLIDADTFTGEPGFSAPAYEVDYSPNKLHCDVLLNGSAYAPKGKSVTKVQVGMKVGDLTKTFNVIGNRKWAAGVGISPGYPEIFQKMPITYDTAFGGVDNYLKNEKKHKAYMLNPVGKGYHAHTATDLVDGTPMPNTEEVGNPIKLPNQDYKPMSFGPIARGWEPRYKYGGTYDDAWLENQFPFLPKDFNEEYFQSAPKDQQMPFPIGGEEVLLINVSPRKSRLEFKLPTLDIPIIFFQKKGDDIIKQAVIDTIIFEPDFNLFTITWRTNIELRKNIFEIPQILVGRQTKAWWRARTMGKTYYPSLAHWVRANRPVDEKNGNEEQAA
ncbi:DUF2169 domain-containing protein [Cocleimonas flava]|uniref:DUF2169 domain-containing protein n=2 Tax=Cocleimonas flava TaxID=634765 RepID=A0A4R1F4N9_9GAMM|nr:hypothetical protein EV695_1999 [Cocleimonas flava]